MTTLLEQVARLVDPGAFKEGSGDWFPEMVARRKCAEAQADSILSLVTAAMEKKVESLRSERLPTGWPRLTTVPKYDAGTLSAVLAEIKKMKEM